METTHGKLSLIQEFKNKIKRQWDKLTDHDIESSHGDSKEFTNRLKNAYGYSDQQAYMEFSKFREAHPHDFSEWRENLPTDGYDVNSPAAPIVPRKDEPKIQ